MMLMKYLLLTYLLRLEQCEAQQYTRNGFLASSAQAAIGANTLVWASPHSLSPSATSRAACIAEAASETTAEDVLTRSKK